MVIRSHMVITETRLTRKLIMDEEEMGLLLPRIAAEKFPDVERNRFYVLFANTEAHGHTGSCPGYALLTSHGRATKPRKDKFRERFGTSIERTLTVEARIDTCKDRIAATERVRERKRASSRARCRGCA